MDPVNFGKSAASATVGSDRFPANFFSAEFLVWFPKLFQL